MATSRSSSWTAEARVFSGRPDPSWPVPDALADDLTALWVTLEPWQGPPPEAPQLGYRGVHLTDSVLYEAYGGCVTCAGDARRDEERAFERAILASAPPGVLPDWAQV